MVLSLGGSAMAYALSNADAAGSLSIPGWKLVFIILGCLTVLVGAIFFFFIPDTPQKAFFLDTEQKEAALRVQAANGSCNDSAPIQFYQIREALTDPLFWLPGIASGLTCVPNGGLTNFFSILIQGFGFSDQQTFLLGLGNSWVLVINIAFLWLGDKVRNRCSMAFLPLAMSITGAAMVWGIPEAQQTARLLGYYLTYSYVVPSNILIALIIANTAGRTKKMVASGGYLLFYCIGNLVGPQTFREKDAPTYAPALATVVACNIATAGCFVAMWWLYARRNAQRDKHIASGDLPDADTFTGDITDRENPYFKYIL
jgi:ACS family allantoate permease-like MFS transporter